MLQLSQCIIHHPSVRIKNWEQTHGSEDKLLKHILEDKVGIVLSGETNKEVIKQVNEAANYLKSKSRTLASNATLSHLDFSLANAQIGPSGQLYGLVDWGDFGLTNASLSLYQLAYRDVWPHVQHQYESLGGILREDIIYAATTIHLAYAPVICRQRNFPLDIDETRERFGAIWTEFKKRS